MRYQKYILKITQANHNLEFIASKNDLALLDFIIKV